MNAKKTPDTNADINKETKNTNEKNDKDKNNINSIIEAKKRKAVLLQANAAANPNANASENHAKKKRKPHKPSGYHNKSGDNRENNREFKETKEFKGTKENKEPRENINVKKEYTPFKKRPHTGKGFRERQLEREKQEKEKNIETEKFGFKGFDASVSPAREENAGGGFAVEIPEQPISVPLPVPIIDDEEKLEIVGVRFKPVGKIYFFCPDEIQYEINEKVIVETSRGIELGYVVIKNKEVGISKIIQPLKHVQRKATEADIEKMQNNKKLAKQAITIAEERVKTHGLKLKIIEAEYTFDNSKLLYYFTAENRIDFRELVKDLASIFKIRIELRQIGIRDQTKIVGGLSICGRPFCCNSFLQDFEQVTIKMAKEQNIQINSAKISGACGKLMCCLRYEHETYESLYKEMPKVNSIVETSAGETGVVVESNVLTGVCKVKINAKNNDQMVGTVKPYPKKELKMIGFVKGEQENNSSNNSGLI